MRISMSKIPEVMESSAENVRQNFERLGDQYIFDIINDIAEKQPMITGEFHSTLQFIKDKLSKYDIPKEIVSNLMDNVVYRMFAILKSLYIQEEVNDLEEQANIHVEQDNKN